MEEIEHAHTHAHCYIMPGSMGLIQSLVAFRMGFIINKLDQKSFYNMENHYRSSNERLITKKK